MKKRKKSVRCLSIIVLFCCMLAGCNANTMGENDINQPTISPAGKDTKKDLQPTSQPTPWPTKSVQGTDPVTETDENVIIWTIPDGISVEEMERNVLLVNEKLATDGYEFRMKLQTASMWKYNEEIVPVLETGQTDIASLGMQMMQAGAGYPEDLVRAGYFEELSSYLSSETGQKLRQEYTEKEWKIVETDGGVYSVPNQRDMRGGDYFFAFNRNYVTEDMVQNFSGNVNELALLIEQLDVPESVNKIIGDYGRERLAALCGEVFSDGVLFNLETCQVTNPYQNELFCQGLRELNGLYKEGYIKVSDAKKMEAAIKQKNFVVWLDNKYSGIYDEIKEDLIIVPAYFSLPNALSCSTGICKNSDKKEEALELLTLVYTNEEYANLLIYGKEGEDYRIKDGYTYDMAGEEFATSWRTLFIGTYDHVLPSKRDTMTTNRKEKKDTMFNSKYCLDSAVLGFQVDATKLDEQMYNAIIVSENQYDIWKRDDFEAALQDAANAFEEAGGGLLVQELQRQVQEWKNLMGE